MNLVGAASAVCAVLLIVLPTVIGIAVTIAHFGPGTWRAISGRDSGELS